MRTDTFLLFASFFLSFFLILMSKKGVNQKPQYTPKAIGGINTIFHKDLSLLHDQIISFKAATQAFQNQIIEKNSLSSEYLALRDAAKKVEFFIEYLDKEAFDKTINGAPLPKLEKKVADLTILPPKGLQVIDELIGLEILSAEERIYLVKQASKLENDVKNCKEFLSVRRVTDRQFFEASRQAIIRLASLGITGFDTPGTQLGLQDALTVLQTQKQYIKEYDIELSNIKNETLLSDYTSTLDLGIAQLKAQDFESLDRLLFIKEVINPLYKKIREIHTALDYETIYEVAKYDPSVNYEVDNLFEKDFLNKFYYVSLINDSLYDPMASLGKLLFYDPILSQNNSMSCASCHLPQKAFTDGKPTSISNTGSPLKRNAMTLNYSVYASGFFYDLRTKRLEDQFEHVVLSKDEFNSDYAEVISKLTLSDEYSALFKRAFPSYTEPIKPNNVDYALAAYIMKLNTFDSPVDRYFQDASHSLSESVRRGFNLFTGKANCASCHFLPTFSGLVPPLYKDSEVEVLGVPERNTAPWILDDDIGRLGNGITQDVAYFYENAFKTPTLRNIDKTAPYMHNGVYNTLEEVMDFYNKGGGAGLDLGIGHQTLAPDPLDLTESEIEDIISFMKALNDKTEFKAPLRLPRDFKVEKLNTRKFIK